MPAPPDIRRLHVVVLAAGRGTRMKSDLAKVLHVAAGRPLLSWVLDATDSIRPATKTVVVGHQAEAVRAILPSGARSVLQVPQLGTGHAALLALDALEPDEDDVVVVLPGDMPLISGETLQALIATHDEDTDAVVVSVIAEDPHGYGRVVRQGEAVVGIVEELDATDEQRRIDEVNTSVYSFTAGPLRRALADVGRDNAQGEQYLTDVIGRLAARDSAIRVVVAPTIEGLGVNTAAQLATVGELLKARRSSGSQDQPISLR